MGPRRRAGMPLGVTLCTLLLVLAACGEASPLSRAAERVAANTGRSAEDVIAGIRRLLPGATDAEVVSATERAAAETDWIAVLAAQRDEAAKTARAVHDATCAVVPAAKQILSAPPDQRDAAVIKVVINDLKARHLTATEAKLQEIAQGVDQHLLPLLLTGKLDDPAGAALDLGCVFEVP